MSEDNMQKHDLRKLIMMIKENKPDLNANLSLEFDCVIQTTDVKPLIKCFNYCFNFLSQLTDSAIETSLNASYENYILNLIIATDKAEFPAINPQVVEVLKDYNAILEFDAEAGKFAKILITFS